MSDEMTLKQRKWLKLYLELGNATEAAMKVYDCKDRNTASQIGWENLRKLDFADLMEESGITDERLNKKLAEGMEATRVKTSLTEPDRIVADYPTQHKYLETALKLKRKLIERQEISGKDGEPLKINIISYGNYDPTQLSATQAHDSGVERLTSVSSLELAPEGTEDNTSDK